MLILMFVNQPVYEKISESVETSGYRLGLVGSGSNCARVRAGIKRLLSAGRILPSPRLCHCVVVLTRVASTMLFPGYSP